VPRLLRARRPEDAEEERKVRKLAGSRHAPGDWINRARMIALSWKGLRTARIAERLRCHPQTVRERIHRFNAEGIDGLGDRPRAGRKGVVVPPSAPGHFLPPSPYKVVAVSSARIALRYQL
jgi:hypothetical protein